MVGSRKKTHPDYRPPRVLKTPRISMALPHTTGFAEAVGQGRYYLVDGRFSVDLYAVPTVANNGPSVFTRAVLERVKRLDFRKDSGRSLVEEQLQMFAAKVIGGELPEEASYISKCNTLNLEEQAFVLSSCASCICPYCELSPSYRRRNADPR